MMPSGVMTPARNSSAITSTMPEPQIPLTPSSAAAAANPGSSDHSSEPMIRKRGSSVSRSIRTRSMAPGAARCPDEIWAPSKAGPVGDEAASSRSRLPSTISAFVPTSTTSRTSPSARCGVSARITPAVSAPTCPAMHGSTYARAPGCAVMPSSTAHVRTARSVASANGAVPSGVGSMPSRRWCMIGLPTNASSRMLARSTPASRASPVTSAFNAALTARVISPAPSGWSIAYDTRLMRSSPNRICGFITPDEASSSPLARRTRCPASVVEPTSIATPYRSSW